MKKIIAIILALMLVLSLAACNTDNLAEYKKALEKTDQITKGQFSADLSMVMDYNTDDMTAEEIKDLSYYKDMSGSFNVVYDDEAEKTILRNYMNFGGLGFDFDMYIDGEEMVMKLPVVGKYIKMNELNELNELDEMNTANIDEESYDQTIISDETMKAIADKWVSLMKEDDVFKGKDIILTTPDGEVKTTEYTITLSDEQIRTLVKESLPVIAKDESLKKFYGEYVTFNVNEEEITFENMIESIEENIENYMIENFKYTALVDIDGYIVSENITYSIKSTKQDLILRGMDFNLDIKTWDINKEQNFEFPVLTDENTVKTDVMEEMPDLMKDLFESKN
ncbi:MAG: hypothetical protein AB7V48_07185 [Sedimentibacter sp.]